MKKSYFIVLFFLLSYLAVPLKGDALILEERVYFRNAVSNTQALIYPAAIQDVSAFGVPVDANSLAEAMDINPNLLLNVTVDGPGAGRGAFLGNDKVIPKKGNNFAVLSTGVAGTPKAEPGFDFEPFSSVADYQTLTIELYIPEGSNRLNFYYNFLTAETPDYNTEFYADTFTVRLTDAQGTQEIVNITPNHSSVIPASDAIAAGTGFDLFTADPLSGINFEFSGGLPDAGLTEYQLVSIPVTGGQNITLEFDIRDQGDGLVDSAVFLDNLSVTSVDIIDPIPNLVDGAGKIIEDTEVLAAANGPFREGLAADGVTQLLLRKKLDQSGSVLFCLTNPASSYSGGLKPLGTEVLQNCILTESVLTAQGFMAFAIYQAPDEFSRNAFDENLAQRTADIYSRFIPDSGETEMEDVTTLKIERPPLVLVHGLWGSPSTWSFPLVADSRFQTITLADYESTNASFFATNQNVVKQSIEEALMLKRQENIAVTQTDVIGHSMGGVLGRIHTTLPDYMNSANYFKGDVHKLMLLNSPQLGSPLANGAVGFRDSLPTLIKGIVLGLLNSKGIPIDEGALDDLALASPAILSLSANNVGTHSLVGVTPDTPTDLLPEPLNTLYSVLSFLDINEIFKGEGHDYIVPQISQEAGLPNEAITVLTGLETAHTSVTGNANYSQRLVELLNAPVDSLLFAPLPATLDVYDDVLAIYATPSPMVQLTQSDAKDKIWTVKENTLNMKFLKDFVNYKTSETVFINVESNVLTESVNHVLVVTSIGSWQDDEAPFDFQIPLPSEYVGDITFQALGKSEENILYTSQKQSINVKAEAELVSIKIFPRKGLIVGIQDKRQLYVMGQYSDKISRNISKASSGTQYQSSNENILTVNPDGLMQAVSSGTVTVSARNGKIHDSVTVSVK